METLAATAFQCSTSAPSLVAMGVAKNTTRSKVCKNSRESVIQISKRITYL